MDEKLIAESLSPIEKSILPFMSENYKSAEEISEKSGSDKTTVLRALEFLKNKQLAEIKASEKKIIEAGINGLYYQKKQLPERRVLNILDEKRSVAISEAEKLCGLSEDELKISIGVLKRKAMINISNQRIILTAKKEEITKKMLEEIFLEKLPLEESQLKPEESYAMKNLQSRKDIIRISIKKDVSAKLSEAGRKIAKTGISENLIEQLTPKIIKANAWKGKKFRRYDIVSPVPRIYGGKRHFVNQATEYAKKIWLEMGFKEMSGSLVQTGFWNFDSLFTPQDHPVREMQDTFFIKNIKGKLPEKKDKRDMFIESVKSAHEGFLKAEDGKKVESKGWQYEWKEEDAKKVLLRTHTTCLSAKTLREVAESVKKGKPQKYFALGKCFRNETVDWSHGFEFNQTEGIVVDENANFRQLLGYLKEFFGKMGYEKIRIRPGYFPYTEPSLEIEIFHPVHKKWLEFGGAGMFRPEVTIPIFGKHVPVLAWGPGFDRIIMEFFEIADLREMYKNDINKLREMKFWRK